jgi:arylsulfatase A-like enzyme
MLLATALVLLPAVLPAATRPNVLVILTDDQGWGDLSLNGNRNLSTPHIDSLSRDGARFSRFYVCPVCSPTRAEFLTGRYHPRGGVYSTSAGGERLDLDERTIGDVFARAGYVTAAFGKWHNGMQPPYHPNSRGFAEFYGFCSGHWGNYFSPPLEHNGRLVRGNGFCIDDFTDRAIQVIEQADRDSKPFLVYLPFNTPHSPMQVPDRWWQVFREKTLLMHHRDVKRPGMGRSKKENIGHIRCALAMCENIDWNVGRLLSTLDRLKLSDDTIVAYFHDNGPNGVRWNGDMRGRKGSTDEGGVRSPLLVRWPRRIPGGLVVDRIAGAIDLLPTLADCSGFPVSGQPGQPLDGRSLKPLLLGSPAPTKTAWADRSIFSHWRGRVSVRTQAHRLDHQGRLYDMQADPGQRRDISGAHPQLAGRLRADVAKWKREVLGELDPKRLRPFTLGHPGSEWTQLPARDGRPAGTITRSNRFPNCSYFTNWTSTDDRVSWPVDVLADGRFEVTLHYAVSKADVGATIELSRGETRLTATISRPHEVPIRGGEHDRVPRQESYVKDFRPLRMGVIELSRGRGDLVLRATGIPGSQAMEFRLLMLRRLPSATPCE